MCTAEFCASSAVFETVGRVLVVLLGDAVSGTCGKGGDWLFEFREADGERLGHHEQRAAERTK